MMSMRRSTYVGGTAGNLRASLHRNSNYGVGGAGGGVGGGVGSGRVGSFHRQDSMPLQHGNAHGGGAGGGSSGLGAGGRTAAVSEKR